MKAKLFDFMCRCVSTKANTLITERAEEIRGQHVGRVTMKGPRFDSRGVYNLSLSLADEINSAEETKCVTGETNNL